MYRLIAPNIMMPKMNTLAMMTPSGREMTLSTNVKVKTPVTIQKNRQSPSVLSRTGTGPPARNSFHRASATAMAADRMRARTPVA